MVGFKWNKSFALPFFLTMILCFLAFADYSGGIASICIDRVLFIKMKKVCKLSTVIRAKSYHSVYC
jgi:hypothetical protein